MVMSSYWRVVGSSVQGTSHLARGVPCQDAHTWSLLPGGALLLAVADGAGSAPRSDEGSLRAVEHLVTWWRGILPDWPPADAEEWAFLMREAFDDTRHALVTHARWAGESLRAFATTLSCAIVTDDLLVVGHIGDGVVVAGDGNGTLEAVVSPQRGEYANEAFFLTMPGALRYVDVHVVPRRVETVAVLTDGLLRLATKLPGYQPFAPFFRPLLAFAAQAEDGAQAHAALASFLASERVSARTDDDKTLVVAARVPCPVEAEEAAEAAVEAEGVV